MNLAEARRARGWTQRHLADVAGVSERTVQRIERGCVASAETKLAVAAALDLAASDVAAHEEPARRTMFPADDATLLALLKRTSAVAVASAPDVVVPSVLLRDVDATLRKPTRASLQSLVRKLRRKRLRLLATDVPAGSKSAAGIMIAPLNGHYSAAWRVA